MRKWIVAVMVMFLAGCAGMGGAKLISNLVEPAGAAGNSFSGEGYSINFTPLNSYSQGIGFTLKNTGAEPIIIIWDECAYIDESGQSGRVMHKGVKYSVSDESQAPSVIAPGTMLTDEAVPTAHVTYSKEVGWITTPLISMMNADYTLRTVEQVTGKRIGLYLSMKIGEKKQAQRFTFELSAAPSQPAQ